MSGGGSSKWRLPIRVVLYFLVGWFALSFNPFGISDKTDLASQDAVYRVLAPGYHSPARDAILVVLLDEAAIRDLHAWRVFEANEWPVRYRDHAYLLGRILSFRPRALFVDIFFRQERSTDDSLPSLLRVLERGRERLGVEVLLSGNFPGVAPTPLQERLEEVADLSLNGWWGFGKAYPLRIGGDFTTAVELYRRVCLDGPHLLVCGGEPLDPAHLRDDAALSVYWGSHSAGALFPEYVHQACEPFAGTGGEMVRQLLRGLAQGLVGNLDPEATRVKCPYHRVVFASELVDVIKRGTPAQKERLSEAIENKVVLYGLALDGLHDVVESPVHGQVPGVFLHAMALDNLMHLGAGYIRASNDFIQNLNLVIWFFLALIFAWGSRWLEDREAEWAARAAARNAEGKPAPDAAKRIADGVTEEEEAPCCCGMGLVECIRSPRQAVLRHPKATMFLFASLVVVGISWAMFSLADYEPFNSIGFISLLGVVGLIRDSGFESCVIHCTQRLFRRLGGWFGGTGDGDGGEAGKEKKTPATARR